MSFPSDFVGVQAEVFDDIGVDATVQRGADAPVPVRIVVKHGRQKLGEFGQVIARQDRVDFLTAQWQPKQGDIVVWTDQLGAHTRTVASPEDDNGYVAQAVLRG